MCALVTGVQTCALPIYLLGGAGRGFEQLMHQLAWERLIIALDAVVGIERALDLTVAYVRERIAFGKPLFAQQNTQFVLADCQAQAKIGRASCRERVCQYV